MTSIERHELRYQRRKMKRKQKILAANDISFESLFSFSNLYKSAKKCCNGIRWKTSTINFELNLIPQICAIRNDLIQDKLKFGKFNSFDTVEHGKLRHIDALSIQHQTIVKCLCKNYLLDLYSNGYIYDNGANLPGKGLDFTVNRFKHHLIHHYHKYGLNGGVLQFDFKNYFASIPHNQIKQIAKKLILKPKIYSLFCKYIDGFLNMKTIDKTASVKRGVGLGSEISPIVALSYAGPIDHMIKDVFKISGYCRHMDDGIIISNSLAELQNLRDVIYDMAQTFHIVMNNKKCIITPFKNHSIQFLKLRISLTSSGKVVLKLSRKSIKAIRRKLYIFRRWLDVGKFDIESICKSYQSWRGYAKHYNSYNSIAALDIKFVKLFEAELADMKRYFPCTIPVDWTTAGWKYYIEKAEKQLQIRSRKNVKFA